MTTWLSPPLSANKGGGREKPSRACPIRNHHFAESTGRSQCTCQSLTLWVFLQHGTLAGSISLPRVPRPTSLWVPHLGTWVPYSLGPCFLRI